MLQPLSSFNPMSNVSKVMIMRGMMESNVIFRCIKYNFCLVVCEISTQYVKRNESYELEKNDGSNGI